MPSLARGTRCGSSVLVGGSTAVGDSTSGPNHWASGPAGSAGAVGSGTHTPAWIRRPTHSIASYSARPQVQARSWAERAPSIAHATAHCSRLSTAEAAPRSRNRTGVVRARLKRAIRSAFLITSASTKSTHRLENAPAQCPLAHCVPGAANLMSETNASRSAGSISTRAASTTTERRMACRSPRLR